MTATKTVKIPGPDHPISLESNPAGIVVSVGGRLIADSRLSIPSIGQRSINAVWTYETPYDAVAPIKVCVAFYPDRVDSIEERPVG